MTLLSTSSSASATTAKPRYCHTSAVHSAPSSAPHTPTTGPSSSPSLPLKAHGVRAHLAELLPLQRHALFAVKLTIHQLWNVPLVAGEFSVKWKFQHVHRVRRPGSANESSLNGSSGRLTLDSIGLLNGKGKGREIADPDHDSVMPSGASMLSIPSTSESSSSPSTSPRTTTVDLPSGNGGGNGGEFSQEARGRTPYVALRDHHVKWGKSVNVAVQMGVQRDTLELQPCELKLVVEQLSLPGDPDAPANPRLGVVYLNLAEYVDEGAVTRRYLLRQSKTNATLQLTLELTHIGGETTYKAPPLQKGEVMAGIATLLEKSAVGGVPRPAYDRALSRPTIRGHRRATDNGSRAGSRSLTPLPELGLGGLRTTDNIIEAIFNPVPTSSPAPSPFTYYVPPKPRPPAPPLAIDSDHANANAGPQSAVSADADVSAGADEDRPPSIAPSARSERSMATSASRDSVSASASGEKHRQKWWQKLAGSSRAASPQPQPPSPVGAAASVRSSPGALRELRDSHFTADNRSTPPIIVRSPTTMSKASSTLSSGSWSHRS